MVRLKVATIAVTAGSLAGATAVLATETITYTYDAKGGVTKVVHSGTVNNGVTVDYAHDRADNRTRVKVSGAP